MGLVDEKKGDHDRACQFFAKAIELNPEFQLARDALERIDHPGKEIAPP